MRGKLLAFLQEECDGGELRWTGGLAPLADPQQFARFLAPLSAKEWAVYAEPPHVSTVRSPHIIVPIFVTTRTVGLWD